MYVYRCEAGFSIVANYLNTELGICSPGMSFMCEGIDHIVS